MDDLYPNLDEETGLDFDSTKPVPQWLDDGDYEQWEDEYEEWDDDEGPESTAECEGL